MSLSDRIAPHIPFLRRYARALTGNQETGDTYAAAALEAIVDNNDLVGDEETARRDLYKVLTKVWTGLSPSEQSGATREEWESNLQAIAPLPRQVLLLTSVENFSNDETAHILSLDPSAISDLQDQALTSIKNQIRTDVLIIEDEPLIALDIEQLTTSLGHKIIGTARTREEAVQLSKTHQPGLVLADIQLADGSSGIDAVNDMLADFSVPVIFITAFPERLLTGDKPEPAYLVTKPFNPETVRALISQALFFQEKSSIAA